MKVIVTLLFIASLANRGDGYDAALAKNGPDCQEKQFTTSDFKDAASVGIFCREDRAGGKTANLAARSKTAISASACLYASNKNLRICSFESQYAAASGLNKHTLFSLHCLLTV